MTDAHRAEYLRRIHRAQDYIESHLGEALTLEEVARAACFSPFHFHRLYSAITGESLYQFILRLRLERAATQLVSNPDKSITAIAFDNGFSSSATFARAFRAEYEQSASDYRVSKGGCGVPAERKNRKTLSKNGKAATEGFGDNGLVDPTNPSTRSAIMSVAAKHVTVEQQAAFSVAYVRHVGPYAGNAALFEQLFGKLMAWAGPRGLIGPHTQALCVYHDNPDITDSSKLRLSCCVSVPSGTQVDGEVGLMEIPAGTYAKAHFEIAAQDFGNAWQWFMGEWMPQSGYQPADGVCYELALNDPSQHPEGKHIVQITEPVKPL